MNEKIRKLIVASLGYGAGGMISRVVIFLLLPILTIYLTPSDYGINAILDFIGMMATPLFSLGLGASIGICYFEGDDKQRKEKTVWTAFAILFASVLVLGFIGFKFPSAISFLAFQTSRYRLLVTMSFLSTCLSILTLPFIYYLQFENKVLAYATLGVISTFASLITSIIFVAVLKKGVYGLVEAGLISNGIIFLLFIWPAVWGNMPRFDLNVAKDLVKIGIQIVPGSVGLFVLQHGNRYMLQRLDNLRVVGIYTIGYSLGMGMSIIVNGFTSAWAPFFLSYMERKEEGSKLFARVLTYYVFGLGFLNLLFYIAAKPVIMLMTTSPFHDAYKVVGLVATSQFLIGAFSIFLPDVYFAKQLKYTMLIQIFSAAVSLCLNFVAIPYLGITGAALSLMLGYLLMAVLQYLWNARNGKRYLRVPYEWNRILTFALVYVCCCTATLWRRDLPLFQEACYSLVVLGLTTASLYLLLTGHERSVLRSVVSSRLKMGLHLVGK